MDPSSSLRKVGDSTDIHQRAWLLTTYIVHLWTCLLKYCRSMDYLYIWKIIKYLLLLRFPIKDITANILKKSY